MNINRENYRKIRKVAFHTKRWKNFCFTQKDIEKLEQNREYLFDLLKNGKDIENSLYKNEHLYKQEILGDGNVVSHSKAQYNITKKYGSLDFDLENLKDLEKYNKLRILALIHDIGEIGAGDLVHNLKNDNHEKQEKKVGKNLLKLLFEEESLKEINKIYNINFNKKDKLYPNFRTYEILSYLNGAILAHRNRENMLSSDLAIINCLTNQIPKILEYIKKGEKSVIHFINDNLLELEEIFENIEYKYVTEIPEINLINPENNFILDNIDTFYKKTIPEWELIKIIIENPLIKN